MSASTKVFIMNKFLNRIIGVLSILIIPAMLIAVFFSGRTASEDATTLVDDFINEESLTNLSDKAKDGLTTIKENVEKTLESSETTVDDDNDVSPSNKEYSRDEFGTAWKDVDKNGCSTRDDILSRDLTNITMKDSCVVTSGTLDDDYSGSAIDFVRGKSKVDIDHIIPLSYAWKYGNASEWTQEKREQFANDPINLQAVHMSENRSKGDSGPSEWMPTNTSYHCEYVESFVNVANAYGIKITKADQKVINSAC